MCALLFEQRSERRSFELLQQAETKGDPSENSGHSSLGQMGPSKGQESGYTKASLFTVSPKAVGRSSLANPIDPRGIHVRLQDVLEAFMFYFLVDGFLFSWVRLLIK